MLKNQIFTFVYLNHTTCMPTFVQILSILAQSFSVNFLRNFPVNFAQIFHFQRIFLGDYTAQ